MYICPLNWSSSFTLEYDLSASEVVREALRLTEQKDELRAIQRKELGNRIDKGLAEAESGGGEDGEAFVHALLEDLHERECKRRAG